MILALSMMASLLMCSSPLAQDCHNTSVTLFTPGGLTTNKDLAGQLFWLPNGLNGSALRPISRCVTISVDARQRLEFAIGNAIDPIDARERATFVAVQVVRILDGPQRARVRISRFGDWSRSAVQLTTIDDQPVDGMSFSAFLSVHTNMSDDRPGDEQIRFGTTLWHGVPARGIYSSMSSGPQFSSLDINSFATNENAVLSNRLHAISIPPERKTWFYVSTFGTKEIVIHTFSPNRPEFEQTVRVVLR